MGRDKSVQIAQANKAAEIAADESAVKAAEAANESEFQQEEAPNPHANLDLRFNDDGDMTVYNDTEEELPAVEEPTEEQPEPQAADTEAESVSSDSRIKDLQRSLSEKDILLKEAKTQMETMMGMMKEMQQSKPTVNQDGAMPSLDPMEIFSDLPKATGYIGAIANEVVKIATKELREEIAAMKQPVGKINEALQAQSLVDAHPDFLNYKPQIKALKDKFPELTFEKAYEMAKIASGASGAKGEAAESKMAKTESNTPKVSRGLTADDIRARKLASGVQRGEGNGRNGAGQPLKKKFETVRESFWDAVEQHTQTRER